MGAKMSDASPLISMPHIQVFPKCRVENAGISSCEFNRVFYSVCMINLGKCSPLPTMHAELRHILSSTVMPTEIPNTFCICSVMQSNLLFFLSRFKNIYKHLLLLTLSIGKCRQKERDQHEGMDLAVCGATE